MTIVPLTHSPRFWERVWGGLLRTKIRVPPQPTLPAFLADAATLARYKLLLVYIPPGITEERYPRSFVKPGWEQLQKYRPTVVEHLPLRGGWALVEAIQKPDWLPNNGYLDDVLIAEWDIGKRYEIPWTIAVRLASEGVEKKFALPSRSAFLMSAEEWSLTANLFNWLRRRRCIALPNLGATNSSEWCRNAVPHEMSADGQRGKHGLTIGWKTSGGLANLSHWDEASRSTGFRFIIWLEPAA